MKYIIDSVLNYVKKENTNYAILLNGKWGSGKTHFWETELKGRIEKIKAGEDKSEKEINFKTIYISLYGISSIDEINKRIVMNNLINKSDALQSLKNSKQRGRITEFSKMGIGVIKNLDIPFLKDIMDTNVNYENLVNLANTVICFDDLERANIDIADILGYINNFVEHDGSKVIIIGYEDEIAEKLIYRNIELKMLVSSMVLDKTGALNSSNTGRTGTENDDPIPINQLIRNKANLLFQRSNEYKLIKEKLIGKTLTISPDYPNIISGIIKEFTNVELKRFLNKNLDNINIVFKESHTDNIRILKQGLEDFKTIYNKYKANYNELGEEVLTAILVFTLAVSFEIKSGREGNEKLSGMKNDDLFLESLKKMNKNYEKTFFDKFMARYSLVLKKVSGVIIYPFAEQLVREGIFNLEKFSLEMNEMKEKVGPDYPAYFKLIQGDFYDMSDEDFMKATEEAYEKLANGKVPFISYLRSYNLFKELIEKRLFQKDLETVKKDLLHGLSLSSKGATYFQGINTYFIGIDSDRVPQDVIEFKEKIVSINKELEVESNKMKAQELISYITTDFKRFIYEVREHNFAVPIFRDCDTGDLFKNVLSLTNSNIETFRVLLEKRYSDEEDIKNYKLFLDKEPLSSLKEKIESYLDGKNNSLKLSFLHTLKCSIGKLIDLMENIEKESNAN